MTTNILVAGKDAANVKLIKAAVDEHDYQVIPATSMSLALFLAHKNLPELIICSSQLVDGDPLTLLQELQADQELKQIPFMLLAETSLCEADRSKLMSAGAALVLSNDIASADLLSTFQPYIDARLERKEERIVETSE